MKESAWLSMRTISGQFSGNLIDKSPYRILTTHARTSPILHDAWSLKLGENRPNRTLKYLVAMLKEPTL